MDIILEVIVEFYLELMMLIVPQEKLTLKKYRTKMLCIACGVLSAVLALFVWGCILCVNYNNLLGLVPILAAIIISLVQIFAGVFLHTKKNK